MKHISFIKRNLYLALGAFALLATSCIKEDLDACSKLTLKVVNYRNDDVTLLGQDVRDASLYVYDENKALLETRQLDADFIKNRKEIVLNYPEGTKLFLVAYGNLGGGNQIVNKGTKADDFSIDLNTNADGQAFSPDTLFYGNKTVETIGAGGYVGGDQEITIYPRTGTVTMLTVNLNKALRSRNLLKAGEEPDYQFQVNRTMQSLDYNGAKAGKEVHFNPDGKYDKNMEWATPEKTNMYTDAKLGGVIYSNGIEIGWAEDAENVETGEMEPITVYPQRNTLIQLIWDNNGAFLGAKVKITPWGVVDDEIEF